MYLGKKVKVLVADDSNFIRTLLTRELSKFPGITVIDTACNGKEVVEKNQTLKPDVIVLDVVMPIMDGIETLKEVMKTRPVPIIIFSSTARHSREIVCKALNLGAVDVIAKPCDFKDFKQAVKDLALRIMSTARSHTKLRRVYALDSIPSSPHGGLKVPKVISEERKKSKIAQQLKGKPKRAVVIAASTGGPRAVKIVLSSLHAKSDVCVFIVQHMPKGFTETFAQHLNVCTEYDVKEAGDGEKVFGGHAYVAPGGYHMLVDSKISYTIRLYNGPKKHGVKPAADYTLESVAKIWKENMIAVILTGMGCDGLEGSKKVKEHGGYVIAQDEETSIVWGMPGEIVRAGLADKVLPLNMISHEINKLLSKPRLR